MRRETRHHSSLTSPLAVGLHGDWPPAAADEERLLAILIAIDDASGVRLSKLSGACLNFGGDCCRLSPPVAFELAKEIRPLLCVRSGVRTRGGVVDLWLAIPAAICAAIPDMFTSRGLMLPSSSLPSPISGASTAAPPAPGWATSPVENPPIRCRAATAAPAFRSFDGFSTT